MFKTAALLHALVHPSEEGGSAAGVLITDKYLKPCGDAGATFGLEKGCRENSTAGHCRRSGGSFAIR